MTLEFNLLREQEATALKFGNDKTATSSASSSLILYTQKGLPNREVVRGLGKNSSKQKEIRSWISSLVPTLQILILQEHHLGK
jgi:hypothetical protein